ncbi:MAG: site-2 protease family protein [Erysipelotrichaceae bacterium]|nr:site-2 protease family protein [Erysipelotrichaceae bacterium]
MEYLSLGIAVILSMSFHELAHGVVSYWFGDPTPKLEGRLTLNPLRHIDWMGLLCLLIFRFGWAKPVPVNARYYKHPKTGMIWTAFAGPMANFILAFVSLFLVCLIYKLNVSGPIALPLTGICMDTALISIGFGIFNLLPIPPLDGSKVFWGFLPDDEYFSIIQYNSPVITLIFFALLYMGFIIRPLTFFQNTIFQAMFDFWRMIFGI